ncbi:DUF6456 domain-containing protein [Maricaulis parjimensis]|uniref:DUF6456 domain-containing protein n=1 Tax=Maricaulis parjimensis TaxID=144023 RepID=UPI001EEE8177|nr:DUF6456 domain-containing protein [Maricaulis parjimensis]
MGQVEAALKAGWLEMIGPDYRLTSAGQDSVRQDTTPPGQERVERLIADGAGGLRRVSVNPDEGPLAKWRGFLSVEAQTAAERFLSDYVRSTLRQSVTRNWSPTAPRRGETPVRGPEDAALTALAAKDRVMNALDELGPEFARIVEAVLIREESLAAIERRFGWARRSGRTGVVLALNRLAQVYGMVHR